MTEKTNKDIDPSILKKLKIKLSEISDLTNEKFEDFIQNKLLYPSKKLEKVPFIKKANKNINKAINKSLTKNKKDGKISEGSKFVARQYGGRIGK